MNHFLVYFVVAALLLGGLCWFGSQKAKDEDVLRHTIKHDRPQITAYVGRRTDKPDIYRIQAIDPHSGKQAEVLIRVNEEGQLIFSHYDTELVDRPVAAEWTVVCNPPITP